MHRGLIPYLQDYAGGLIVIHHLVNDWLEEVLVTCGERGGFVMAVPRRSSTAGGGCAQQEQQESPGAKGKGRGHLLWSSMPSRRGTLRQ